MSRIFPMPTKLRTTQSRAFDLNAAYCPYAREKPEQTTQKGHEAAEEQKEEEGATCLAEGQKLPLLDHRHRRNGPVVKGPTRRSRAASQESIENGCRVNMPLSEATTPPPNRSRSPPPPEPHDVSTKQTSLGVGHSDKPTYDDDVDGSFCMAMAEMT